MADNTDKQRVNREALVIPALFTVDRVALQRRWQKLTLRLRLAIMLFSLVFVNTFIFFPVHTSAATANMFLFWDPADTRYTLPSDWSVITTLPGCTGSADCTVSGKFPRGDTVANYNGRGGEATRPFTPATGSTSLTVINDAGEANSNTAALAINGHVHPNPSYTISADTAPSGGDTTFVDYPAFRDLQLIEYTPGGTPSGVLPTSIPAGAIAMFNTLPTGGGFVQYGGPPGNTTVQNGRYVRIGSSSVTGGNDTVVNTLTLTSGLTAPTGTTGIQGPGLGSSVRSAATATHTHSFPTTTQTDTTASIPQYVQPILGQATAAQPTIGINLTAMFDADPGNSWAILSSSSGQPYFNKLVQPNTTYDGTGGGADSHTSSYSFTSNTATGSTNTNRPLIFLGGNASVPAHQHVFSVTTAAVSNIPPYFNMIFAQKVSFTLNAYRWYTEVTPATENVTDPHPAGAVDIAPDTQMPAIPAAYKTPTVGDQIRLRVQILVSGNPLIAGATSFKLQYQQTTDGSCLNGTWKNLEDADAVWQYGTNTVTDSTPLTASRLASTVREVFSKSATGGTTINGASSGTTIEYDWLIQNVNANPGVEYHIRPIETSGTPLSLYTKADTTNECPSIVSRPSTDQQLRHGNFFQEGVEKGFSWAD